MADDLMIGPFGRLLPRPAILAARKTPLEDPNLHSSVGTDPMYSRSDNSAKMPLVTAHSNQGYQLPPFNQILGHHEIRHHQSTEPLRPLERDHPTATAHHIHGGQDSRQDPWGPYGAEIENGNLYHHPTAQTSETALLSKSKNFPYNNGSYIPQDSHSPIALSSLATQHNSSCTSGVNAASIHPQGRRVLREEHIPGRGICYVYEDGTICPKAVDGDSVNPQWGITKAGKPRKRLAQACTTCREKKIKCDPGTPKCIQCQKFGRECRFEPFSRSNPRSPSSQSVSQSPTPSNLASPVPLHRDSMTSNEQSNYTSSRPISSSNKSSMTLDNLLSPRTHDNSRVEDENSDKPAKRKRRSDSSSDTLGELPPITSRTRKMASQSPDPGAKFEDMAWKVDPFEIDHKLADHYLSEYFNYTSTTTYWIFPQKAFLRWARQCRNKSKWDRTLLYAMLAYGTVFASNPEKEYHGRTFARIATEGNSESAGEHRLQVVHAKMTMAQYKFAMSDFNAAWDYCGAALRTACGIGFNIERAVNDVQDMEYDFSRATVIECRRRTFWSLYVLDRFSGFGNGRNCMLADADCLLRLPCTDESYQDGNPSLGPYWERRERHKNRDQADHSEMGILGYLVQLASIFGEVVTMGLRTENKTPEDPGEPFEDFYQMTMTRIRLWEKRLPGYLKYSLDNVARADEKGYLSGFGILHTVHNGTLMSLNRHVSCDELNREQVRRNLQAAYHYATRTMKMMQALHSRNARGRNLGPGFVVSSPYASFAILTAIDILTARGKLADLLDTHSQTMSMVATGVQVLEELGIHWRSAKDQTKLVSQRYSDLMMTVKSPCAIKKVVFYCSKPLASILGPELDLVYSIPRRQYLEAVFGVTVNDDDVLEIRSLKGEARMDAYRIWDSGGG